MNELKYSATVQQPKRLKITNRTLAILDFAIPFHIIDIGPDGLDFRYVGTEKWFEDPIKIDLVHGEVFLQQIPVKTVSDHRMQNDIVQTRRHSVKFDDLTSLQIRQLDQFITECSR